MSKSMTLEEQIKDLRDHIHNGPIIGRRISVDALLMSHDRLTAALEYIVRRGYTGAEAVAREALARLKEPA